MTAVLAVIYAVILSVNIVFALNFTDCGTYSNPTFRSNVVVVWNTQTSTPESVTEVQIYQPIERNRYYVSLNPAQTTLSSLRALPHVHDVSKRDDYVDLCDILGKSNTTRRCFTTPMIERRSYTCECPFQPGIYYFDQTSYMLSPLNITLDSLPTVQTIQNTYQVNVSIIDTSIKEQVACYRYEGVI